MTMSVGVTLDRFVDDGVSGIAGLQQLAVDLVVLAARCHFRLGQDFFAVLSLFGQVRIEAKGAAHFDDVDNVHLATAAPRDVAGELNRHQARLATVDRYKDRLER